MNSTPMSEGGPNITTKDVENIMKEGGIPYKVRHNAQFGTDYIQYTAPGNKIGGENIQTKVPGAPDIAAPKIRVPSPTQQHTGNPRPEERHTLIDTTNPNYVPPGWNNSSIKNAGGESYGGDLDALRRAIYWRTLTKLVPEGSEPASLMTDRYANAPTAPLTDPHLGQKSMIGQMLGMKGGRAQDQRLPNVVGGSDPENAFNSKTMARRFNLTTPKEFGDFGNKGYNPDADISYQKLLEVLNRTPSSGNDQ
jgi:hypothetical protein